MTITWHVDDLKFSHKDPAEVTKVIKWLEAKYGKLSVSRGKRHDYLGMDLDFSDLGKVMVSMVKYLEEAIEDFPEHLDTGVSTPAQAHTSNLKGKANC